MRQQDRSVNPNQITTEQQTEAAQRNFILPTKYVGTFKKGDTTPNIKNVEHWLAKNTSPVTIVDFKSGQNGQLLTILGDGQTSIADNAKIKSGGGHLFAVNTIYNFTLFDGVWYEH